MTDQIPPYCKWSTAAGRHAQPGAEESASRAATSQTCVAQGGSRWRGRAYGPQEKQIQSNLTFINHK